MRYYYNNYNGLIYRMNLLNDKLEVMYTYTGTWIQAIRFKNCLTNSKEFSSISPIAVHWFEKDHGYIQHFRST